MGQVAHPFLQELTVTFMVIIKIIKVVFLIIVFGHSQKNFKKMDITLHWLENGILHRNQLVLIIINIMIILVNKVFIGILYTMKTVKK